MPALCGLRKCVAGALAIRYSVRNRAEADSFT
jgi:hypothetical protein